MGPSSSTPCRTLARTREWMRQIVEHELEQRFEDVELADAIGWERSLRRGLHDRRNEDLRRGQVEKVVGRVDDSRTIAGRSWSTRTDPQLVEVDLPSRCSSSQVAAAQSDAQLHVDTRQDCEAVIGQMASASKVIQAMRGSQ